MKKTLFILTFATLHLWGASQSQKLTNVEIQQLQKLNQVMQYMATNYVEPINMEDIVNKAIISALKELDPHSSFISKEDAMQNNERDRGNFEGIGIEFNILNDTLIVVNTVPRGPAEKIGLLPSDRIIEVNGTSTVGITQSDVPKILRGMKGTVAEAKVIRKGSSEVLTFKIIRDKIPIHSIDIAYYIEPEIGYIKLNRFAATTSQELRTALLKLVDAKAIILDLRGNPGGYYLESIKVVSEFMEPGKLAVFSSGRSIPRSDEYTFGQPTYLDGKLVVLVDQNSASSSEIVAGALQDWDRAIIVGRRTFGKGLIQNATRLIDGSILQLTVAQYFTPSGRSIQQPYKLGHQKEYYENFIRRYTSGELTSDTLIVDSSIIYKTLVKGRNVYGGGGILPDVIIPIDTTSYTKYWGELLRNSVFIEYVVSDLDKNRATYLKTYPDFAAFNENYVITSKVLEPFVQFAEKKGISRNDEQLKTSNGEITTYLKALLASRLYDDEDFYKVMNRSNSVEVEKALEIITKGQDLDDFVINHP